MGKLYKSLMIDGAIVLAEVVDERAAYDVIPETPMLWPNLGLDTSTLTKQIETQDVWGKYLMSCLKTWNNKYPLALQVTNACLGVVGELTELLQIEDLKSEDFISEFGDLLYYRTILSYLFGVSLALEALEDEPDNSSVYQCVSLLSDVGKKSFFHTKISSIKNLNRLKLGLNYLDTIIIDLLKNSEIALDEIMLYNIAKLSNRHNSGSFNPNYT